MGFFNDPMFVCSVNNLSVLRQSDRELSFSSAQCGTQEEEITQTAQQEYLSNPTPVRICDSGRKRRKDLSVFLNV